VRESEGRLFYALLGCLAEIAVPLLNVERSDQGKPALAWISTDMAANEMPIRGLVFQYILGNISSMLSEVDSGRHKRTFSALLGRRFLMSDRVKIQKLSTHIESDFFIPGFVEDGAIFVQLGKSIEEERVFVVKGLSDPFSRIFAVAVENTAASCLVFHTVLVPWGGCIIYDSVLQKAEERRSPKELEAQQQRACGAYVRALNKGQVYRQLDGQSSLSRLVAPKKALRVTNIFEQWHMQSENEKERQEGKKTTVNISAIFWTPFEDIDDPRAIKLIGRITAGLDKEARVGWKRVAVQSIDLADADDCIFCGKTPFSRCCKAGHLRLQKHARKKNAPGIAECAYDPITQENAEIMHAECDVLVNCAGLDTSALTGSAGVPVRSWEVPGMKELLRRHMLVSPTEWQRLSLTVPKTMIAVLKARLNDAPVFHTTASGEKWDYIGYYALQFPGSGMMTFGDITLDESGVLSGQVMTGRRATALIQELRYVTCDMDVAAPTLVSERKKHGHSADEATLSENKALLGMGLRDEVAFSEEIKKGHSCCAYCHVRSAPDRPKMRKCTGCAVVYYCNAVCQKSHWKEHKRPCRASAAAAAPKKK
jgi:hypothetical protein